ncbi:hypothetical protein NN3_02320 [Nocardia neocaledoniensis NBRC 108232]|uniref:Abortive infection protein n=1 Tax=Nocardia neocaledoniensis TaxID=236511 RepID=A0A317ND35_9NOCA|nr:hypothetical protein [Nocardia neocaledoniensis]PWV71588.1 hypothetical protein DFR69_11072 [Nocardia neocaledoniensis]GEM29225.1 hypothetical protein NN3_02320 [Nocardia neocaledoniensis NBRC 108232]
MRATGITYDTGFLRDGLSSRPHFDTDVVRAELRIIRDDLHCTAVRIVGGDADRLELAATHAADLGLEVWFSPYPLEQDTEQMRTFLLDCAERAELLRRRGAEVVLVIGAELSLMTGGFLPGDTVTERVASLTDADALPERVAHASERLNAFFHATVPAVRKRFTGRLTYASIPLERVDWTLFDLISVDLYRSAAVADRFADGVRALVTQGKPVAVTEFGAATFRGAGDVGANGLDIVEYNPGPVRLTATHTRDEEGQATYVRELLDLFEDAGIDTAFVFLFALYDMPHRPDGDPRDDLDLASYGIVKVLDGRTGTAYPTMNWEPKAAFAAVAEHYRDARAATRMG